MKATLHTPYGTLQNLHVHFAEDVMEMLGIQSTSIEYISRNRIRVHYMYGDALYILDNGKYQLALIRHNLMFSTEMEEYYNYDYLCNNAKWYCRMIKESATDVYNALGISCATLFR